MSDYEPRFLAIKAAKVVNGELYLAVDWGLHGATAAFRAEIQAIELSSGSSWSRRDRAAEGRIVLRINAVKELSAVSPDAAAALEVLALPRTALKKHNARKRLSYGRDSSLR